MKTGYRVEFPAQQIALVKDGVWAAPGLPELAGLLNELTKHLDNMGPAAGFDQDWAIARRIAAMQNGRVLDPPAPLPPDDGANVAKVY